MLFSRKLTTAILIMLSIWLTGCAGPRGGGKYLGQTLPGDEPELFAPGIVCTGMDVRDVAMTPAGDEIYFITHVGGFRYSAILVTKLVDGRWTQPEVAPFSTSPAWSHIEPHISPDGETFFFVSDRPVGNAEDGNSDIWVMDRKPDGWGEPYNLGAPVNTEQEEFFPSVTAGGTLYFTRADPATRIHHIYRSRLVDGVYTEPEKLPDVVNGGRSSFNAFIAPDESYLIVPIFGLPDSRGGTDYYICFRDENDVWTGPVNMGDKVNTPTGGEWSPYVSPDGKSFFFMSQRTLKTLDDEPPSYTRLLEMQASPGSGNSDIYWMSTGFFADLEAEAAAKADLNGAYLGQTPPGADPEIFAPGIVSTQFLDRDLLISPDGTEIYFGMMDLGRVTLRVTRLVDGRWTTPEFAPFAADPDFAVLEPAFSADGNTIYFLSNRAAPDQEKRPGWGNQNIWAVDRVDDGWGEPYALPGPITTADFEYYPSLTADGTLYYTRDSRGDHAGIWRSRPVDGGWGEPEKLGPEVNCGEDNYNAFIAPDESYLIYCVGGYEKNLGAADYYISFRSTDDTWSEAVNLGEKINGENERAGSAYVSPDGRYLFFSGARVDDETCFPGGEMTLDRLEDLHGGPGNGKLDIFWVDAAFLEELRP